jgi:two-component system response regulator MtrA
VSPGDSSQEVTAVAAILVADDDPDLGELVAFKLRLDGHEVTLVEDGDSALEAARNTDFDLAILDWMMPGLSGVQVCRALRESGTPNAPAIMMLTARNREPDIDEGFRAGAIDYLTKPFSPRELASRVRAVLARSGR